MTCVIKCVMTCLMTCVMAMVCVFRIQDKSVDIEVSWERSSVCPSQEFSIEASGFRMVTFYIRPRAIDCGKSAVVARAGAAICGVSNIASNILSLYVNAEGDSKCAITIN